MLQWTINDFSVYGSLTGCTVKWYYACPYYGVETSNLTGCTVKWYYACPYYGVETSKCRLKHSGKNVYIKHWLWLPYGHEFWL